MIKELVAGLLAVILLCWLALLVSAPLSGPGGEAIPAGTSVKAPWIFLGLQVLLAHFHPLIAGVLLPLAALAFLALLPLEKRFSIPARVSSTLLGLLIFIVAGLTLYGFLQ